MTTKCANNNYNRFAVGRGETNIRRKLCGKCESDLCRYGCSVPETIDHLFFDCIHLIPKRRELKKKSEELNLEFNLSNIFTNLKMKTYVEQFISYITNFYD